MLFSPDSHRSFSRLLDLQVFSASFLSVFLFLFFFSPFPLLSSPDDDSRSLAACPCFTETSLGRGILGFGELRADFASVLSESSNVCSVQWLIRELTGKSIGCCKSLVSVRNLKRGWRTAIVVSKSTIYSELKWARFALVKKDGFCIAPAVVRRQTAKQRNCGQVPFVHGSIASKQSCSPHYFTCSFHSDSISTVMKHTALLTALMPYSPQSTRFCSPNCLLLASSGFDHEWVN